MKQQTREQSKPAAAAERQMQAWARTTEQADRESRTDGPHASAVEKKTHLVIARQMGAGATAVAKIISQRLGWKVLDDELLDMVAERYNLPRMMLELVDETEPSWMYNVLGTWMDRQIIPHDKFIRYLKSVLRGVSRQGEAIVIGRGAQFMMPPETGLSVHLVAPMKARIDRVRQCEGLSEAEARRTILDKDRGRREFVEHFFHRSADDPGQFDLVLNTERLGIPATAEHIIAALGR
jgi:cytidylate kinase